MDDAIRSDADDKRLTALRKIDVLACVERKLTIELDEILSDE